MRRLPSLGAQDEGAKIVDAVIGTGVTVYAAVGLLIALKFCAILALIALFVIGEALEPKEEFVGGELACDKRH